MVCVITVILSALDSSDYGADISYGITAWTVILLVLMELVLLVILSVRSSWTNQPPTSLSLRLEHLRKLETNCCA
jgi:hypothetical protein